VFSTTLDVTEIEMLYLKQNDLTSIAIEKHATGSSGEIYINNSKTETLHLALNFGLLKTHS